MLRGHGSRRYRLPGNCFGLPLWNIYFAGIAEITQNCEQFFADDLNIFRKFSCTVPDTTVWQDLTQQKHKIHAWGGRRNRVQFEPAKEQMVIIHPVRGKGDDFRLLFFDKAADMVFLDWLNVVVGAQATL